MPSPQQQWSLHPVTPVIPGEPFEAIVEGADPNPLDWPIEVVLREVAERLAEALEKLDEAGWDDFETIEFARARLAEFTGRSY